MFRVVPPASHSGNAHRTEDSRNTSLTVTDASSQRAAPLTNHTGSESAKSAGHAPINENLLSVRPSSLGSPPTKPAVDIFPTPSPSSAHSELLIPQEYTVKPAEEAWCTERYGLEYLHNLVRSATPYCDPSVSQSKLTCFHSQTEGGRIDNFCVSSPSSLNKRKMKFELNCHLKDFPGEDGSSGNQVAIGTTERWGHKMREGDEELEEGHPAPPLRQFGTYWTGTGPAVVIPEYMEFEPKGKLVSRAPDASRAFTVIVKREGTVENYWHSLMEVLSLTWTLDVLQMAKDPATDKPFWTAEDMNRTQVLILDDGVEGPNYELWRLMAKKPIIRAEHLPVNFSINRSNIIVPLQGSSNPLWQGDWQVHACAQSELLQTFTQRVFDFHGLEPLEDSGDRPLVVTYLNRTGSRQLRDLDMFAEHLQQKYPHTKMQLIELGGMPLRDQIQIIQGTDILVGVHGAGLTHCMFLPPRSTVVEIEPPKIGYKGFRNMAKLRGHQYFSTHAFLDQNKTVTGDWHFDHVWIPEERFQDLMEVAIKSAYNKYMRNIDVA